MFCSLTAQNSLFRVFVVFAVCVALLLSSVPLWISNVTAQGADRTARPRPGKPEGTFPDLAQIKKDSNTTREPDPPIPSTMRSPKSPLRPWDGRRVGDPGTQGVGRTAVKESSKVVAQVGENSSLRSRDRKLSAHASGSAIAPPTVFDYQFIANFFNWAVLRAPNGTEPTYWNDQLRVAYAQGQTPLKLSAIELGKTLFESAEYAERNRDNHWYVYDLYKTYLMRDPDAPGWAHWESQVPLNGRENVRRAFEEAPEFAAIVASIVPSGSPTADAASLISARIDPKNQPGNGILTRDGTWSVPLLSLPGRAGLDFGLGLSYSSMVWTRNGPYIHFDEDNGFPSPGFRLGFPVVQRKVFDAQTSKNSFLFITAAGRRVELRQVGSSNTYEAGDSSYLQLIDNSPNLVVRSTDGTQLSFVEINNEYSCTQIKDRNGNYITITHNGLGRMTSVIDTLGRVVSFNYDGNANLISITQRWNSQPSHQWVGFNWSTRPMQASFSDAAEIGPKTGTPLPVITQVTLNDTSHFTFEYNNSLQVYLIRNYFGALQRSETTFTYDTPAGDVPRLIDSRISAHNWTGINEVSPQVITTYSVAGDGACVMTAPDGTIYREYYGTGWQRGLTTLTEVWSGGVRQKWTTTAWTQDNTSVGYEVNPRVTETNVYDVSNNRRRTTMEYHASFGLLWQLTEYSVDPDVALRRTRLEYKNDAAYVDRRIIGLLFRHSVYDGSWNLVSKSEYNYDWESGGDMFQDTPVPATQHDRINYGPSFVVGRGNRSQVARYDVNDPNNSNNTIVETKWRYNSTGSVLMERDHLWHQKFIAYGDAFSDSVDRNTFAYPTTITHAGGSSSQVQYNFDFGARTRTQGPPPANQSQGAIQTMIYNNLGQLEKVTTTNNGAYERFWYGPDYTASYATVNNVSDELYSIEVFDGAGRVIGEAANHPSSPSTGYSLVNTIYNQMGRVWKKSNPTEVDSAWVPGGDDAAGMNYTLQTYDWAGRPLVTTHPDGKTKEASYAGCGCAGGTVVTETDEGTYDAVLVFRRRQKKTYTDVLGRTVKTEILIWQSPDVYSATVNTYNARDQVTKVRAYAGPEGSGTYQDTDLTYDGHGRLSTKHVPEQTVGTATVMTYNADDTVNSITDARGASRTFTYNSRHLITNITYAAPGGITVPAPVSFTYDAVGNRTQMTDGFGNHTYQYNELSRLTQESRQLPVGTFSISYSHNLAGQLTGLTDPFGAGFTYTRDVQGRLKTVTGTPYAGFTSYITDVQYRAWGGAKSVTYNGSNSTIAYNSRMQPTQFRLLFSSGGGMREDYGFMPDGRVSVIYDLDDTEGSNPPWTRRYLSREYIYDHVGRVTNGSGLQSSPHLLPFSQNYSYDHFGNMTSRSGNYYNYGSTGWKTDTATYTNNRRGNWSYNAEGQTIGTPSTSTDFPRTMTYDAAGRMLTTVETNPQVTVTYSAAYDGDGKLVRETSGPSSATQTSYIVRSTVLGGDVLTRLDASGNKLTTHVPAEGLLFATQRSSGAPGPWVMMTHRNPLGTSETFRAIYDPLGNFVPFTPYQDPRPPVGSYNSGSMGGLSASQANPDSYAVGCIMDGMPTSCNRAMQVINRDAARSVSIHGLATAPFIMRLMASFMPVTHTRTLRLEADGNTSDTIASGGDAGHFEGGYSHNYASWVITRFVIAPGGQLGFEPTPSGQDPDDSDLNNPDSIGNDKRDVCSLSVAFTGTSTLAGMKNGPGETDLGEPGPSYGVGFTVSGSVRKGQIRGVSTDTVMPLLNPKGSWQIQQFVSLYNEFQYDGYPTRGVSSHPTEPDGPNPYFREMRGQTFTYVDFPGPAKSTKLGNLVEYYGKWNFHIKLIDGSQQCEVKFKIFMQLKDGKFEAKWGSGHF